MTTFIYFDLGGVVIDDFSGNDKWQQLKDELGVTAEKDAAFERLWDQYVAKMEIDLDTELFLAICKKELGLRLPATYSLLDGLVNRFYANHSIWPIIEEVHKKIKIGLLTNMYPGMFAAIKRRKILPPHIAWDVILDSTIERLQKPDRRFFELAEQKAGATGKQIIFIDNSLRHIAAAKNFGWETFLYEPEEHEKSCKELRGVLRDRVGLS